MDLSDEDFDLDLDVGSERRNKTTSNSVAQIKREAQKQLKTSQKVEDVQLQKRAALARTMKKLNAVELAQGRPIKSRVEIRQSSGPCLVRPCAIGRLDFRR